MARIKKEEKVKFYSLSRILSFGCLYNMIFGERSNGKTYAVHMYMVDKFWNKGEQSAIIRRWEEDFRGRNGQATFDGIVSNGEIEKLTKGEWTTIRYFAGKWYFARFDEKLNRVISMEEPFCYGFALTMGEHYKSTSYTKITTILFDEFLTRDGYIPNEFVSFQNVLSTIIRQRDNVKIFMLGNTVNKYSPYFEEMGIRNHVEKMKSGDIEIVSYGDSGLTLAIEYCASTKQGKLSDKYFAFDNPKLKMITGGEWELALYPHLPYKYTRDEVKLEFFIMFDHQTLHCEVIKLKKKKDDESRIGVFTYVHRKTTPIQNEKDIVFSPTYSTNPHHFRKISKPREKLDRKISKIFLNERVFYQSNEVGEIIRNYLEWCQTDKLG